MNQVFPYEFREKITSQETASEIMQSMGHYGSVDQYIATMQKHLQYNDLYQLSYSASLTIESADAYGALHDNNPFIRSATIALSGLLVVVGMSKMQQKKIPKTTVEIKAHTAEDDDEAQTLLLAQRIIDIGYDGYYAMPSHLRSVYDQLEPSIISDEDHLLRGRAGFGFPYALVSLAIQEEQQEDVNILKQKIDNDEFSIDWDAEFAALSSDNKER